MASYLTAFITRNCFGPGTTTSTAKQPDPASIESTPASTDCRYRLDDSTLATFTLPDGRQLSYAQYGAQGGRTIFYLHGIPGSRMEGTYFDAKGKQVGARFIGVDRPGIGYSSPQPNRTLLDHAKDVELLAEHLDAKEYGVIGVSGGGPYALACAKAIPAERLKAVSIVCGLGSHDMTMRGAGWENWAGWTYGYPYVPSLCSWYLRRQMPGQLHIPDERRFELMRADFYNSNPPKRDFEAIKKDEDLFRVTIRSGREYYRQEYDAIAQDGKLLSSPLGFRIEDIRPDLPISLWYGKQDKNVPLNHGVQIAKRLGNAANLRIVDETHTSIFIYWREKAIDDLLASMRNPRTHLIAKESQM